MTHPVLESIKAVRNPLAAAEATMQEVATRRPDEISRVARRAADIKSMATDKASASDLRGLSPAALELSRGVAAMQVADHGLDAVGKTLKRIVVLIDKADEDPGSGDDLETLQAEMASLRFDVSRLSKSSSGDPSRTMDQIKRAIAGIEGEFDDAEKIAQARRIVDNALGMVEAARGSLAVLSEHLSESIRTEGALTVGPGNLSTVRFETATSALEGAARFRALIMRDWASGLAAQANSSRPEALRALIE